MRNIVSLCSISNVYIISAVALLVLTLTHTNIICSGILYTNDQHIAFYPPLGKKPCLAISFDEILSARICEEEDTASSCPLPGLFVLAIDTAYKCHYLIFLQVLQRENFLQKLNDALFHMGNESHSRKKTKEFESFRMSLETSLTGSVGKWRAVTTGSKGKDKKKQRRVLNGRKMSFDTVPIYNRETDGGASAQEKIALYVENLLRMALSFSPDTFERAADSQFIEFLDECSRLRTMSLHDIDFTSKEAFCIFVNLYHCLLQHSLLLGKKFRVSCICCKAFNFTHKLHSLHPSC